jgi:hypothetical protein
MRTYASVVSLLALAGCAHWFGPADGILYVVGATPENASCELSVAVVGSTAQPSASMVSGEFRERFMVHPSRKGHRADLICDGNLVLSRPFKYGRDVNFGGDLPVTGGAP